MTNDPKVFVIKRNDGEYYCIDTFWPGLSIDHASHLTYARASQLLADWPKTFANCTIEEDPLGALDKPRRPIG